MQCAIDVKNPPTALPTRQPALRPASCKALSAEALLQQCRRGEPAAFDALLHRYADPIHRLAYRLTGNSCDAEDLAQEAFCRIYTTLGTVRGPTALPAWIQRIVCNVFFDSCRRNRGLRTLSLESLLANRSEAVLTCAGHATLSPAACAEANERQALLNRAIGTLPHSLRRTVALFYCAERTYEEIAAIQQIPLGTVRSRLSRGRLALRQRLTSERAAFQD